ARPRGQPANREAPAASGHHQRRIPSPRVEEASPAGRAGATGSDAVHRSCDGLSLVAQLAEQVGLELGQDVRAVIASLENRGELAAETADLPRGASVDGSRRGGADSPRGNVRDLMQCPRLAMVWD